MRHGWLDKASGNEAGAPAAWGPAMSEGKRQPWFQFTVARILGAIFWMAVCCAAYLLSRAGPNPNAVAGGAAIAMLLSPFISLGTLFGRPFGGAVVGLGVIAAYFLVVFIALYMGWIRQI